MNVKMAPKGAALENTKCSFFFFDFELDLHHCLPSGPVFVISPGVRENSFLLSCLVICVFMCIKCKHIALLINLSPQLSVIHNVVQPPPTHASQNFLFT